MTVTVTVVRAGELDSGSELDAIGSSLRTAVRLAQKMNCCSDQTVRPGLKANGHHPRHDDSDSVYVTNVDSGAR